MFSGAYSHRYQCIENQQLEQLKQNGLSNRVDVLAKSKLLSHETNRRRRAIAIKRKLEVQKEEKRRQEILLKRRQRQKEATEKFQRQTLKRSPKSGDVSPQKSPTSGRTVSPKRGVTSLLIPGLEEALKAVRGNSPGRNASIPGSSKSNTISDHSRGSQQAESHADGVRRAFYSKYGSQTGLLSKDRLKEQEDRKELHNRSLRNLTNSRSLFEQQLEQHQQLLLEQHQNSLREFNAVIHQEILPESQCVIEETGAIGKQDSKISHSESLSSLDSLEAHCSPEKENSFTDIGPVEADTHTPAVEQVTNNRTSEVSSQGSNLRNIGPGGQSTGSHHGKPSAKSHTSTLGIPIVESSRSDITIDTVSTIDIRDGNQPKQTTVPPKQFFLPRYNTFSDNLPSNKANSGMVNEWVNQQNVLLNHSENQITNGVKNLSVTEADNEKNTKDAGTFYVKAWAPSSPVNGVVKAVGDCKSSNQSPDVRRPTQQSGGPSQGKQTEIPTVPVKPFAPDKPVSDLPNHNVTTSVKPPTDRPSPVSRIPQPVQPQKPAVVSEESAIGANRGVGISNGHLAVNKEELDSRSESSDCSGIIHAKSAVKPNEVRSILKKVPSSSERYHENGNFKRSNSFGGRASSAFDVRDSLEVMRHHKKSDDKSKDSKKKKSVRFAEKDDVQGETTENHNQGQTTVTEQSPTHKTVVTHKPPRPTSAKVTSSSPKDSPSPGRRVVSAGVVRPSPPSNKTKPMVRPQAAAHIITHQSSFNSPVTTASGYQISLVSPPNNRVQSNSTRPQLSATKTTVPLFQKAPPPPGKYPPPVYDDMGLRMDRTPTDDEINWLWDKVRTCLHRDPQTSSRGSETTENSARQTVVMSSKVFDGNMLGQHANVARVASTNLRRYNSAESVNSYSKRSALLQQRQQQQPHSITSHRLTSKTGSSGPYQSPKLSKQDPHHAALNTNQNNDVTESMAGFLTAEALAEQSVSDSVMETAVDLAQQQQQVINSNRPSDKIPTALSIEEQRLMESIDKLNEKLKITENKALTSEHIGLQQQQQYIHTPGFRGHQPLVAANKGIADNGLKIHYRTGSGTVTRAQTQYKYY